MLYQLSYTPPNGAGPDGRAYHKFPVPDAERH